MRADTNPTKRVYEGLNAAYDAFNDNLFSGELPRCLITMQRKSKAYGYFAPERFGEIKGTDKVHEIALNPEHFRNRTTRQTLSTLAHEMAHLWQQVFGKPGTDAHHNKEWAAKMKALGLYPSSTGAPGGKETGRKVSHYIIEAGPFDLACTEFMRSGFEIPYGDLWAEDEEKAKAKKTKKASKTKFTCPACAVNAWGKPDLKIICGGCDEVMLAENGEGGGKEA